MKASQVVANFIRGHVNHVFAVSGGADLHLLDSLDRAGVAIICPQSEAAAGFAADAYARLHGLGVVVTTSGPGATNLVSAIATSYYDSVPVLYITGQQTRSRMKDKIHPGIRQYGFQECPIVDIVRPVTKWVYQMKGSDLNPDVWTEVWDTAIRTTQQCRAGPVLIDIPDDLQRENV